MIIVPIEVQRRAGCRKLMLFHAEVPEGNSRVVSLMCVQVRSSALHADKCTCVQSWQMKYEQRLNIADHLPPALSESACK